MCKAAKGGIAKPRVAKLLSLSSFIKKNVLLSKATQKKSEVRERGKARFLITVFKDLISLGV